jgi:tetratricopeptide (TPR) repeat protein
MLNHGFQLGLCVTVLGFALAAWKSYVAKIPPIDAAKLAEKLMEPLQGELATKNEQIKALTAAITALSKADAPASRIDEALQALQRGDAKQAQAIFAEELKTKEAKGCAANKEAAAVARHLGALAYMNNTKEALAAYQKAVELDPDNADGWNGLGNLLLRTGELAQAEMAYRKALAVGGTKEWQAKASGNLGNVYATHGDLAQAEVMYNKALVLDEALGHKEGMAADYGNLGLVYETRGDLAQAGEMFQKALVLNEALGSKEGMAINYSNLGLVHAARGDLAQAEDMHRKSLMIDEAFGNKEGIAANYGNLGSVHFKRGDLAQAEEMHKKSLVLHEALGSKEYMAANYANLGLVYKKRGELGKAEELWKKSLLLYQEMGHPDAKEVQQWLDDLAKESSVFLSPAAAPLLPDRQRNAEPPAASRQKTPCRIPHRLDTLRIASLLNAAARCGYFHRVD